MEDKKILLSVKDLHVKFRVRGRILSAIRGVSLDLYENESIAIVGESGSGKSVFTKTFAGMLETNGFISQGQLLYNDEELADTTVAYGSAERRQVASSAKLLNKYSRLELGADIYKEMIELKSANKARYALTDEEDQEISAKISELEYKRTQLGNLQQTINSSKEKDRAKAVKQEIAELTDKIKKLEEEKRQLLAAHKLSADGDAEYNKNYTEQMNALKEKYAIAISKEISEETKSRNLVIAKEIYLSVGRYGFKSRQKHIAALHSQMKEAMRLGVDLNDDNVRSAVFDKVVFRVKYLDENEKTLHGTCILDLAKVKYAKDWTKIRGGRIATVFQDPMTSLNPIITIGKQITSIILKHQNCSELEARSRALQLMKKVGIPNAENRFDDYPFQYSGGMRQRIVIAIALSCQPKILICDEPTTALDVTIQAQILKLIKDLQKEFNYTIVFITHDLGVVANIADRVAVLYAGQIVEVGTVEDVFYDPRHPYTWALLSSLPQLAQRNTKLYSITGTPPSLYNDIVGDSFAPRNPYCLKIDTLKEPPMFRVSDTHYAKTWLLDPRAPKLQKPEIIEDIHEKLKRTFNI